MIPLSIHIKKVKISHYHLGQLNWPVSQFSLQRSMLGFLVEGHMCTVCVLCDSVQSGLHGMFILSWDTSMHVLSFGMQHLIYCTHAHFNFRSHNILIGYAHLYVYELKAVEIEGCGLRCCYVTRKLKSTAASKVYGPHGICHIIVLCYQKGGFVRTPRTSLDSPLVTLGHNILCTQ